MALKKRSITLRGHRTSISLEEEFWEELSRISSLKNRPIQKLVEEIDKTRTGNLSSALRIYVLTQLRPK